MSFPSIGPAGPKKSEDHLDFSFVSGPTRSTLAKRVVELLAMDQKLESSPATAPALAAERFVQITPSVPPYILPPPVRQQEVFVPRKLSFSSCGNGGDNCESNLLSESNSKDEGVGSDLRGDMGLFPEDFPCTGETQEMFLNIMHFLLTQKVTKVANFYVEDRSQTVVWFGDTTHLTPVNEDEKFQFALNGELVKLMVGNDEELVCLEGCRKVIIFELKSQIYAYIDHPANQNGAKNKIEGKITDNVWLLSSDAKLTRPYTIGELTQPIDYST